MRPRRAREISVSRRRKVLAKFLQTQKRTEGVGAPRLGDIQARSISPIIGSHEIHELSARAKHTIYSAAVEADLRVIFRIDDSWVTTLDVGTHKIYRG